MKPRSRDAPFVGRIEALAGLLGLLTRVERGEAGASLVAGEAGVGKTRLLREVARRAAARDVRVLTGGCVPFGADVLPYAPFVEALREHLADGDATVELVGESTRAYQFERMLEVLRGLAATEPVLLILEDLHWADQTTLQLLVFLARNLRRDRIGLVVSWRDDELRRAHPLRQVVAELGRFDTVSRVDLRPFEATETAQLLAGIHGGPVSPDVSARIHERSQGNPFLAEELFAASAYDDGSPLPATLRDVLLARVVGLDEPTRDLLRLVAVIGGRIDHTLLVTATKGQVSDRELPRMLRDTVEGGLLCSQGSGYVFHHELVAQAIVDDLLPFERARLHAVAADALEQVAAPRWEWRRPAEIASHRLAAHQLDAALTAFIAAGAAAAEVAAFAEARQQLETALDLWDRVPDAEAVTGLHRADVLIRAAKHANMAGDPGRAIALGEAARKAVSSDDPERLGVVHLCLGHFRWAEGHGEEALAAYERAVQLAPAERATTVRAHVLSWYAYALLQTGAYGRARDMAEEATAIAQTTGDRREEARARTIRGAALVEAGDIDGGLREITKGREAGAELGRTDDELNAYEALGDALDRASRLTEAVAAYAEGAQVAKERGLARVHGANLLAHQAQSLMRLGHWNEAREVLDEASQLCTGGNVALLVALAWTTWALDTGDLERADHHLQHADTLAARGVVTARVKAWQAIAHAIANQLRGRLDAAAADVANGLDCLEGTDDQWGRAQLCVLGLMIEADRAELARVIGDDDALELACTRGREFAALLQRTIPAQLPTGNAERISGEAELRRIEGVADPDGWMAVADEWARFGERWAEACACWRAAEAAVALGRDDLASQALFRARSALDELPPCAPLVTAIEGLAQRARLPALPSSGADEPPAVDLGLTEREQEVLALLGRGRTNSEIGAALVISPKTASVHVTNIMRKLGVRRRVEAAGVAHRLGLLN
jgi:DNA-binding CsgD family transcriptional regulator/tetratricopeptide (TPR) repeat protein